MNKNSAQPALSILVVDDNVVHRRMSQTILTAAGYGVRLAEGGPQALAAFEKNPADVALIDVHMPGMDGFEVCRRLRALPDGKRVPVLFLTDVSDLSSPDSAVLSGGDDFLNKPINRIELLMRVRSLSKKDITRPCSQASSNRSTRPSPSPMPGARPLEPPGSKSTRVAGERGSRKILEQHAPDRALSPGI
jgi:CheY-like chemotaxis protein